MTAQSLLDRLRLKEEAVDLFYLRESGCLVLR
jgi:hypothetical protein